LDSHPHGPGRDDPVVGLEVEFGRPAGISTISPSGAPTTAELWLSSGTTGQSYEVAITTNTARVLRRSMVVRVVGR